MPEIDEVLEGLAEVKRLLAAQKRIFHVGHVADAITLLKGQAAVKPMTEAAVYDRGYLWYICGACQRNIDRQFKYCPWCGREVQWE